ncbi:MAG TPA: ABC transporter ATP-binding protein [Calidithermus sp.]|nr:ABC transporter ATP-binding protein [Calidithermus sp.]
MIASLRRSDLRVLGRLLGQARPYWPHLAAILVLDLLATPLALLTPVPLKLAVDHVVGSAPLPGPLAALLPSALAGSRLGLLGVVAAMQVAVLLLLHLRDWAWYVLRARAGEGVTLAFRTRLFRHAQRLSLAFHDRRGTADAIYRIQWDAPSIQWLTIDGLIPFVAAAVMLVTMVGVIAWIDLRLAVVALAVAPLLFALSRAFDRRTRHRYHHVKDLETRALGVIQEALGALRVVKAFGREDSEQQRFLERSAAGMRARLRLSVLEGGFGLLVNLTTAVGGAVVLFLGIQQVLAGTLSLGALLAVLAYLGQLYRPLETISRQVASLQDSMAGVRRALELLDQVPEVRERPHARSLPRAAGAVEFRRVSFAYERRPVLREVSFRVAPGTRVGIVGPTGAGKSTLVSLLARFYDPTDGQILLDGLDIRDYRLADLRRQFAFVLQDPVLFSTTIRENIAYGRPGASLDEVQAAARAANADGFIAALPEGYDTVVGERGLTLSGGERQRLAIARAFLKDAPLLILDEPTSALDARTEGLVVDALERLLRGRTTFTIAHRLSTLRHADWLLVLDHGRLVAAGPPSEVLGPDGLVPALRAADGPRGPSVAVSPEA